MKQQQQPRRRQRRRLRSTSLSTLILLLLICFFLTTTTNSNAREIPTKKAMPPLMDPIPTLPEITHRVYMDIQIGNDDDNESIEDDTTTTRRRRIGRIIIGLFGNNAPTATENFRLLSTCHHHHHATGSTTTKVKCYKDTIFHRIIPNFIIQGGDTTHGTGIGGYAAITTSTMTTTTGIGTYQPYMINATTFNRPYMVAVATPNTQLAKSQFFITTVKTQWLYSLNYTIFGMILNDENGREYIHTIEQMVGTYGGHPKHTVRIIDCGELPLQPYDKEPHY